MTSRERYEFALARIEVLLKVVDDATPANTPQAIELALMSDIVIEYEKEHYPIDKPAVSDIIALYLKENGMTQRQLAAKTGVSPSRINDFIAGRSEPSVSYAAQLCRILNIPPAVMLGM